MLDPYDLVTIRVDYSNLSVDSMCVCVSVFLALSQD